MLDDGEKDFKEDLSFDDLPNAVSEIIRRLDRIEQRLNEQVEGNWEEKLFDTKGAAEFLGISRATLYTKMHKDQLPCYRPEGFNRVFFLKGDLIEHIRSGRVKTSEEKRAEMVEKMREMRRKTKGKRY